MDARGRTEARSQVFFCWWMSAQRRIACSSEPSRPPGCERGLGVLGLEFFEVGQQFLLIGPTDEIETDHLVGSLGRLLAGPQSNEQTSDNGAVRLNLHARRIGTQQMPTAQNAVSYTHLRAHETGRNLVCRLLLEKK